MAIDSKQIEAAVNESFSSVEEFGAMLKMLAGVGARVKLEIQRDAANRAVNELHQQMQSAQQQAQTDLEAKNAEFNTQISAKQAEAAALQAQIDALNAMLPDLLK